MLKLTLKIENEKGELVTRVKSYRRDELPDEIEVQDLFESALIYEQRDNEK